MSSYLGPYAEAPDHDELLLLARDGKLGPGRSVHERLPVEKNSSDPSENTARPPLEP
jgi:hypothetical protein